MLERIIQQEAQMVVLKRRYARQEKKPAAQKEAFAGATEASFRMEGRGGGNKRDKKGKSRNRH